MKKILSIFIFIMSFCIFPAFSEPLQGSVAFNWDKLTQTERDEDIQATASKVFTKDIVLEYDKDKFESDIKDFKRDKNFKDNILYAKQGITNIEDRILVPFFYKNILYAYGIIYRKDLKTCYYYTAMGGLFVVEKFAKKYNDFPVNSYQYTKTGILKSAVYNVDDFDQYMYTSSAAFVGRWYRENYYNARGKVIMTRTLPPKSE